jgi:hypothetical protein
VLDPPENDDDDHEIPHDDEQDAVPPQRRRAPTQTRANGARAPVLDEEVSPDWRSIGQRASSKARHNFSCFSFCREYFANILRLSDF